MACSHDYILRCLLFLEVSKNANGQYINNPLIVNNKWRADFDEYHKVLGVHRYPTCLSVEMISND